MNSNQAKSKFQLQRTGKNAHRSHAVEFPVFNVTFTPSPTVLLLGGGGGATKAGIKNAVMLMEVQPKDLGLVTISEHRFQKDDDGCMNISIHPKEKAFVAAVNSPEADVISGNNRNCRSFYITKSGLKPGKRIKTSDSLDGFIHQKSARFSPNGKQLCTGTTDGKLSFLSWPTLKPLMPVQELSGEIIDIHFEPSGGIIGVVTPGAIRFINAAKGNTVWEQPKPTIGAEFFEFRALRFGCNQTAGILFVILNAKSRKSALIQKYDVATKKLVSTTPVSIKPITTFAMSIDGSILAFGSSDLSITVMKAKSLHRIARVQNAHGFPPTSIDINSNNTLVASASADGTCVLTEICQRSQPKSTGWSMVLMFIAIALLVLGVAALWIDGNYDQDL